MKRLRPALIAATLCLAAALGWEWLTGARSARLWTLVVYAVAVLVLLLVERVHYKRILEAPPGDPWRATGERFVDPESGRPVAVWEEPGSGRRAYVAADR